MLHSFILSILILATPAITYKNDFKTFPLDSIAASVEMMVADGLPSHEIVNTVKLELSLKRAKVIIQKMQDVGKLSEEELAQIQNGHIDDNDNELLMILERFGIYFNSTQPSSHTDAPGNTGSEYFHTPETDLSPENRESHTDGLKPNNENLYRGNMQQKPDYAYSPYDQFQLVLAEESLYNPLKKYITRLEARLNILKSYVNDYDGSTGLVTSNLKSDATFEERATAVVSNPLTSYRMIRRFVLKQPELWSSFEQDFEEDLFNDIAQINTRSPPPDAQDWKNTMDALFRIQYYSKYDINELSVGKIGSVVSNVKLSAEQCLEIGLRALSLKKYDLSLEWLHRAQTLQLEKNDLSAIDLNVLNQSINFAITEHNKAVDSYKTNYFDRIDAFTKKVTNLSDIVGAEKISDVFKKVAKLERTQEEYGMPTAMNFATLCSGENLQTEQEKARLHCWLEKTKHPYFTISPMKMELLNEDPYLVQIYDVIGDKQIEMVKASTISRLERSEVINYDDPEANDVSLVRTSSQTWIPKWDISLLGLENLEKLIEKITGLEIRKFGSSEDMQIGYYSVGGHYEEHLDALQDPRRTASFGERIATFMLYLNDVEEGGKTAYPILGTAANPVSRSAVFWYNIKKTGLVDKRTFHGGCPSHGIKWVMNKWILEHENFRNRPCGLSQHE